MKQLIVLETAAQTQWLAEQHMGHRAPEALLAITADAANACQKLNWPYLKVEDYVQVSNQMRAYTALIPRFLDWENWLDDQSQQLMPEFSQAGFRPAQAMSLSLQCLFAELWATIQSARVLLEALRPNTVATWPPEVEGVPWYLLPTVAALPALLPALAPSQNITVENLAMQVPALAPISKADNVSFGLKHSTRWLRYQVHQLRIAAQWRVLRGGWQGCFRQLRPDAPQVLISGYYYDVAPLANTLRQRGVRVRQLSDSLPPLRLFASRPPLPEAFFSKLAAAENELFEMPQLCAPLTWCGLKPTPLWTKPLEAWWRQFVPEMWSHYQRVRRILAQKGYIAVVIWESGANSLCAATANAGAQAGCPSYLYQHGSSAGSSYLAHPMYLRPSYASLVYGEGTAEEIKRNNPQLYPHGRLIPVGSARLDMLREENRPARSLALRQQLQGTDPRPLILYIPTTFKCYGRGVSELAAYPDVTYFELQQRILKLWQSTPQVRLLYKEFGATQDQEHVMAEFIHEHIPDAIVTTQRLTEIMWTVNAIVLDHVGTALVEVLLTRKPLVVYFPQPTTALPQAKRLLEKRATVAETPEAFEAAVRALLRAGTYRDLENPNTEFLQAYGTHLNDGRSAERAADAILSLARR